VAVGDDANIVVDVIVTAVVFGLVSAVVVGVVSIVVVFTVYTFIMCFVVGDAVVRTIILKRHILERHTNFEMIHCEQNNPETVIIK